MTNDSLKDVVNGFGDTDAKEAIVDRFEQQLKNTVIWGEESDLKDVNTAIRKYDYGDASNNTVKEVGVRVRFDPDETVLSELQDGGDIRMKLREIALRHFTCELVNIDLTFVTEDSYELWLIAGQERLIG